jgi:predicted RNA-binding protein associated with RNAse of E/G family
MSTSEVAELIAAMRAGRLTVDEVAERFRRRHWVAARRPAPRTYVEMAAQQDVETDVPGSFDEVVAAYDRGELTREEYRRLAHAVADAINAAPRQD